jgi:hypothetical protein
MQNIGLFRVLCQELLVKLHRPMQPAAFVVFKGGRQGVLHGGTPGQRRGAIGFILLTV